MLAACKAALSGLGQSAVSGGGGGRASPSEKQVEAFVRSLIDCDLDQVAAHVSESRTLLLVPLKAHPARSSAWHLAAAAGALSGSSGRHVGGAQLLQLLLRLYGEQELPAEGLPDLLNTPNKRGQTCLHSAAAHGNAAAVQLLLSLGCEILRADKSGRTALHHAAAAGSEESVRLLLAAAAAAEVAPTAAGEEDARPAAAAAAAAPATGLEGSDGVMQSPSAAAAVAGATPLTSVSQRQLQQPVSGTLVARLASYTDAAGLTPLHFAVAANSLPIVRMLLAAGASYTAQAATDNLEASMPCNAGWTCLHVAAMRGYFEVTMAVLQFHASLSAEERVAAWTPGKNCRTCDPRVLQDRRGTSAHALALSRGFSDLAELLHPETPLSQTVTGRGPEGPDGQELHPPAMFMCPITQEVMSDPVVASDGFTYERAAICRWLSAGKQTSPMTNLLFASRNLYPNNVVKSAIKEWRQEHRLPDPTAPQRSGRRAAGLGLVSAVLFDANNAAGNGNGGGSSGRDPFLTHLRAHGL